LSKIIAAARYAELKHRGQLRKYTGEPYILHPARVAGIVSFLPCSTEVMVQAAWLHDVVEDCGVDIQEIYDHFGVNVAAIVDDLTNPSKKFSALKRAESKQMDRDWISRGFPESKIIKMIDRIDNLRDYPNDNQEAVDFVRDLYYDESVALFEAIYDADAEVAAQFAICLAETKLRFQIGG